MSVRELTGPAPGGRTSLGTALVLSPDIHRRLIAKELLAAAGYEPVLRRALNTIRRDVRVYALVLVVVDHSALRCTTAQRKLLRGLAESVPSWVMVTHGHEWLPVWARRRAIAPEDLATLLLHEGSVVPQGTGASLRRTVPTAARSSA